MTTAETSGHDGTEHTDHDSVATGILAAERRAQEQIQRRRRLLVGSGVLGLVVVGAVLVVMAVLQQQANQRAAEASDRAEARAAFAAVVVQRAEDHEVPAAAVDTAAVELRTALEGLLAETDATDEDLGARADAAIAALEDVATAAAELTERELPEPTSELIDPERAVAVLRGLEELRAETRALEGEIGIALGDVRAWRGAVVDVRDALAAHAEQVAAEEPTSDPEELIELWRAEQPPLLRLSAAASAADTIPGLAAWAGAHQDYAAAVLAWIDEAVALLEDGEVDAYNDRFDELFATDDPFGLSAAVAAATGEALESPALLQLGALQQRAAVMVEAVATAEQIVADELGDDEAAS